MLDNTVLEIVKRVGSIDRSESEQATQQLTQVAKAELREAILSGDILQQYNIFTPVQLERDASPIWPLDILSPGEEDDLVAFTNPGHGRIPEAQLEGSYVTVPTYQIAGAIDWLLNHMRNGRTDLMSRYLEILNYMFVKKINDDGWHTIIASAVDRNILVYDADATAGQFTKRLVSLAKLVMRRNGGGNTSSINRKTLTDIFMSPEGIEDMRNWGVDQVDEVTRRELIMASDGGIRRIFSVNLHDLDELGVGQEYQYFYTNTLGAAVQASDTEMCIGLDLNDDLNFVMPIKQELELFDDPTLHRSQKGGMYGWAEMGFANLDNRSVIVMSY